MLLRLRSILWQRWMMEGFCGESPGREAVTSRVERTEEAVRSPRTQELSDPHDQC